MGPTKCTAGSSRGWSWPSILRLPRQPSSSLEVAVMSEQNVVENVSEAARPTVGIDVASSVRPGEELDVPAVDAFLKAQVPSLQGTPRVTQYAGGASNWTYRLEYKNRDLILRRPPKGT